MDGSAATCTLRGGEGERAREGEGERVHSHNNTMVEERMRGREGARGCGATKAQRIVVTARY